MKCVAQLCLTSLLTFCVTSAHADIVLTGMTAFGANSSGDGVGVNRWETSSSVGNFNLYLTDPGQPITGSFANSGNGVDLAPSITLSTGSNSIFVFAAPGVAADFFGANFFFNGASTPGISVFAETNLTSTPPFPDFFANSSGSTYNLDGSSIAGSGTLAFTDGLQTANLTQFAWSTPTAFGLDRVSGFDIGPDGSNDFVGVLNFNVSAVPEPSSALLLLAVAPFVNFRRRHLRQ